MIQSTTTTRYEPLRLWTWSNRQWQSHYRLIFVANHAELSISSRAATFATFVPVAIRVCVQFVVTMLEYDCHVQHTRSRLAVFKINIRFQYSVTRPHQSNSLFSPSTQEMCGFGILLLEFLLLALVRPIDKEFFFSAKTLLPV
jgi:hypothetical protein